MNAPIKEEIEVPPELLRVATQIITDELATVESILPTPSAGTICDFAINVVTHLLWRGKKDIATSIRSAEIAKKIQHLYERFSSAGISAREVVELLAGEGRCIYGIDKLERNIALTAQLIADGNLRQPLEANSEISTPDATKLVFTNMTYARLIQHSDRQILAMALMSKLTGRSVSAVRRVNPRIRKDVIEQSLAVATDETLQNVAGLVERLDGYIDCVRPNSIATKDFGAFRS